MSRGCTSESHPLFGVFMVRLSRSIFEWDEHDLELLMRAKRGELMQVGVPNPLPSAVKKALSRATNVGNERGEVVISVLTESESIESLQRLADGLMGRYERADQEPPHLLYTDRDCCSEHAWPHQVEG